MKRRDLMRLAPAALVVGASPAALAAVTVEESAIAAMLREITRRSAALDANHGMSDSDFDAASNALMKLADAIIDIPARDADDMLRKIMGYTVNGAHDISDGPAAEKIWAEARALTGGAA